MPEKFTDFLGHHKAQDMQYPIFQLINGQQNADTPYQGYAALIQLAIMETDMLGLDMSDVIAYARSSLKRMEQLDIERMRAIKDFIQQEIVNA